MNSCVFKCDDNNKLKDYIEIIKNNKYFLDLLKNKKEALINNILNVMEIVTYNKEDIIIRNNSKPQGFYIVLSGKVGIFISNIFINQNNNYNNTNFSVDFYNKHIDNDELFDRETKVFNFTKVNEFGEGYSFGEKGIIYNTNTAAMIMSKDEVILGYISVDNFNLYLKKYEIKKIKNKTDFFYDILKNKLSVNEIIDITYYCSEVKYSKNQLVYKKDDLFDNIYFVVNGDYEEFENIKINIKRKTNINSIKPKNSVLYKRYSIKIVKKYNILGIEEYMNKLEKYYANVCALLDKNKLYKISKSNFEILLGKYPNFLNYINKFENTYNRYLLNKDKILQLYDEEFINRVNSNYKFKTKKINSDKQLTEKSDDYIEKDILSKKIETLKSRISVKSSSRINESELSVLLNNNKITNNNEYLQNIKKINLIIKNNTNITKPNNKSIFFRYKNKKVVNKNNISKISISNIFNNCDLLKYKGSLSKSKIKINNKDLKKYDFVTRNKVKFKLLIKNICAK